MSKMKKLIAIASALVISTTCAIGASAITVPEHDVDASFPALNTTADQVYWEVVGYDTSAFVPGQTFNAVYPVYQAYDAAAEAATGNRYPAGPVVSNDLAATYGLPVVTETRLEGPYAELSYPNNEYVLLWALNPLTGEWENTGKVLYTGVSLNLPYRQTNLYWQLAAPYQVFQVTQANFGTANAPVWFSFDGTYPVTPSNEFAIVDVEFDNYFGFGQWRVSGGAMQEWIPADNDIVDYANVSDAIISNGVVVGTTAASWILFNDNDMDNVLEATDFDGVEVVVATNVAGIELGMTRAQVNARFPYNPQDFSYISDVRVDRSVYLSVTGPTYDADGNIEDALGFTASAADYADDLANFGREVLLRNGTVAELGQIAGADTKWVAGGFQFSAPYAIYEYLNVDGVTLDGRLFNTYAVEEEDIVYTGITTVPDWFVVNNLAIPDTVVLNNQTLVVDVADSTLDVYLPYVYRYIMDEDNNPATIPVNSTWRKYVPETVNGVLPLTWNDAAGRFEFIIAVEEVITPVAEPATVLDTNTELVTETGVFATLEFAEVWADRDPTVWGAEKYIEVRAIGEPIAGEYYNEPVAYIDIDGQGYDVVWGALQFNYDDVIAQLDANTGFLADM